MRATALVAILVATSSVFATAQAADRVRGAFVCEKARQFSPESLAAMKKYNSNRMAWAITAIKADIWMGEEARRQCEAAAAGQKADFGCMNSRIDYDALYASIPESIRNAPTKTLGDLNKLKPAVKAAREELAGPKSYEKALQYCDELGVIDRRVSG